MKKILLLLTLALLLSFIFAPRLAIADESFGIGAKVEVEVDRYTESSPSVGVEINPAYVVGGLVSIFIIAFLLIRHRGKRTAAAGALNRGEMHG